MALSVILLWSCDKDKNYPNEPFLEFKSYEEIPGDSLNMTCTFRDGDGDIGSAFIDAQNGFVCPGASDVSQGYQEMIDGEWVDREVDADFCILSLTPQGQDKTLEGEVQMNFPNPILTSTLTGDTVRYSVVLRDRAGNVSNVVWGPMLVND